MWNHLILALLLHQELRYCYFCYQHASASANNDIFPMLSSVNKSSANSGSRYIYIYLDQHS